LLVKSIPPSDRPSISGISSEIINLVRNSINAGGHRLHLAIEGIDGTGKSTALQNVHDILTDQGLSVTTVRYTNKSGPIGKVVNAFYGKGAKHPLIKRVGGLRPIDYA
jgi:hypothetical protein